MMKLDDTKENRALKQVAATLAIEDMYLDQDFLDEVVKVSQGKKTTEQLRQEVIKQYAR